MLELAAHGIARYRVVFTCVVYLQTSETDAADIRVFGTSRSADEQPFDYGTYTAPVRPLPFPWGPRIEHVACLLVKCPNDVATHESVPTDVNIKIIHQKKKCTYMLVYAYVVSFLLHFSMSALLCACASAYLSVRSVVGPSSVRRRSVVGPSSVRRRSVVGPSSVRRRSVVGPSSARRRSVVSPSSDLQYIIL